MLGSSWYDASGFSQSGYPAHGGPPPPGATAEISKCPCDKPPSLHRQTPKIKPVVQPSRSPSVSYCKSIETKLTWDHLGLFDACLFFFWCGFQWCSLGPKDCSGHCSVARSPASVRQGDHGSDHVGTRCSETASLVWRGWVIGYPQSRFRKDLIPWGLIILKPWCWLAPPLGWPLRFGRGNPPQYPSQSGEE